MAGEVSWGEFSYLDGAGGFQVASAKERSKLGGNTGMSSSEKELRVCELWLSWLRTGDKPKSTVPGGMFIHADASRAILSWVVAGATWPRQSLP